jgi:aryl carrier-like protein
MLDYLAERTPWLRPSDTGRSTNCLINEAGISVHKQERGFHNYSMPYSWDVRLGHKQRDPAIEELDDPIEPARVERILRDIGYERRPARSTESTLVAYYVADGELPGSELRGLLERRLPAEAIPAAFVRLDAPPLTPNGKVDRRALAAAAPPQPAAQTQYVAPHTGTEATLARIWADVLGQERVGINDNFFELGGDSIQCVQIVAAAREHGLVFTARDLFSHPTIAALAPRVSTHAETVEAGPASQVSRAEMAELLNEFGDGLP